MSNIDKEQLNKAEMALWRIFNIVSNISLSRPNKHLKEIREIIKKYLDDKISDLEKGKE